MQFPEHNDGKKSTNPKVQKLDKLARLLKVEISIDGVKYGNMDEKTPAAPIKSEEIVKDYVNDKSTEKNDKVEEKTKTTSTSTPTTQKKRGRPKKNT